MSTLRDLAGALQSQRRQTTRRVNPLHAELSRVFPELAVLAPQLSAEWVLKLLDKYPTPQRIAAARSDSLSRIPHIDRDQAEALQAAARQTTGSLCGEFAEHLVRHFVAEVRQSQAAERSLETLLEQAFLALPEGGHRQLLTIPGIGTRTAAALTAKIVSIDRFPTPEALVSYFGVFPEENSSGVDKRGKPGPAGTMKMSAKGNDLVRGLLWMACQSAIRCNPAIRALAARQRARGKRGDVALGHCLRKMLHLVFAVWKTNQPFDLQRCVEPDSEKPLLTVVEPVTTKPVTPARHAEPEAAAGRKGLSPDPQAVTAADTPLATRKIPSVMFGRKTANQTLTSSQTPHIGSGERIAFAELRRQISMTDVLQQLGILQRLHGTGPQRRGPCPLHAPLSENGRTFSVNLDKHVFRCLHPMCHAQGNVLDLWASVQRLSLTDAALQMAATFHLNLNVSPDNENQSP